MAMALVLNAAFPGRNVLRSVVLIPWAMAPVAVGILWGWIFDGSYGTLNALLFDLGLIDRSRSPGSPTALGVQPRGPGPCLEPGAAHLPPGPGRPAVDARTTCIARRASTAPAPVERFFRITLPWLRPMLLLIMILTTINSIMAFDLFWIMTKGGPGSATTVFSWMGYAYAFQFSKLRRGCGDPLRPDDRLPDPGLRSICSCSSATGGGAPLRPAAGDARPARSRDLALRRQRPAPG